MGRARAGVAVTVPRRPCPKAGGGDFRILLLPGNTKGPALIQIRTRTLVLVVVLALVLVLVLVLEGQQCS